MPENQAKWHSLRLSFRPTITASPPLSYSINWLNLRFKSCSID